MTNEDYHTDVSRIGKSGLDLINRSPAHYWAKYLDPNRVREEPTAALLLGTAVHHAILEPHEFERRYQPLPDINRRTNAGKAEYAAIMAQAAAEKITFIDADDRVTCMRMRDAVHRHPAAKVLLATGVAECSIKFEEPQTGAACKIRPDWLSGTGFITDIKTTENASPAGFGKSVVNYRYDVQGAMYTDGYQYGTGDVCEGFVFIAVEKEPPYAVAVYYLTPPIYERGKRQYLTDLWTYVDCLAKNQWPAYSLQAEPLQLPGWAK